MNIKILVAIHKKYWLPKDKVYFPLHVGKAGKADLGFVGDDTGENISEKNPNFCELTGLYWASKNLSCDYIGLVHYRRYFLKGTIRRGLSILSGEDFEHILQDYDVICPKLNDFPMNMKKQYEEGHFLKDLELTQEITEELFPEYAPDFRGFLAQNCAYMYNMFVMKKSLFDEYCAWLFAILFELERRVDIMAYDNYQARIFGFLSERLFNVWLLHHKELRIYRAPVKVIDECWRDNRLLSRRLWRRGLFCPAVKYYLRYLVGKSKGLDILEQDKGGV